MLRLFACLVLLVGFLASPALGQEGDNEVDRALDAFELRFGDVGHVRWSPESPYPEHIWGRAIDSGITRVEESTLRAAAETIFADFADLFGVEPSQMRHKETIYLPLDRAGLTPKWAVSFRQGVADVRVRDGWGSVLFDQWGRILSIANHFVPGTELLDVVPRLTEAQGIAAAKRALGSAVDSIRGVGLEVVTYRDDQGDRYPALAWLVDLRSKNTDAGLPIQREFAIDAHDGRVLWSRSTIHTVDYIGRVEGWVTPAPLPDTNGNPEVLRELRSVRVEVDSTGAEADTDDAGDFTIANGDNTTRTLTTNFNNQSTFAYVVDQAGPEQELSASFTPGVPQTLTYNTGLTEHDTAENNAQDGVIDFHRYVRTQNPNDNNMSFRVRANVNLNSNCNAFFDGSSINFYTSGGGCVNTSYSTVVAHEEGHWANVIYDSGNGGDGFGEGNADNFAMFIYDEPIVGQDFCGPGCHVRTGNNNRQYCGTCGAGCHGGVHSNGEVLMGAFWKWRQNLNAVSYTHLTLPTILRV